MNIEKSWEKALKQTEIIRSRVQALMTMSATQVPYIFLAESSVNMGDTVVRKGEILVERPSIIIPPNNPQFQGFDFEETIEDSSLVNFLYIRGVSFPSLKYDNKTTSMEVFEGKLSEAIKFYLKNLQQEENVKTGLIAGPEDVWPFSLLIFVCSQIAKNANQDIIKLLEQYHNKKRENQ